MTPHKIAERASTDLMNQSQHIERVVEKYNSQEIANNRLRVKATIEVVRWLAFQGCAFRGHDESSSSINRGNFLELLELLASNNEKVGELVLDIRHLKMHVTHHRISKKRFYKFLQLELKMKFVRKLEMRSSV